MAKTSTSFDKDNQPKNKKGRGKSERNKILDAMKKAGKTEDQFYELLVTRALDPDDQFNLKELLLRISPIPKQVAPMVHFEFDHDAKPHEQASDVLKAVSEGLIPPDIGTLFITSIKSMIDIEEYTELKARIDKIEAVLNNESS